MERSSKAGRLYLVFIGLATASLGLLFVWLMGRSYLRAHAMRSWPEVPCVILASELKDRRIDPNGATEYQFAVQYGYEWQGQALTGDHYTWRGSSWSSRKGQTEELVKTYPTGDAASPDINDHHTLCMTFEEMHAVVATAHNHGLKVTGHCRARDGIFNALKAGYDAIEHGTFMDDECLELLLKRNVPMCPGLGFELFSVQRGKDFGLSQRVLDGHQETLEAGAESARMVLKAGGTLGLGGDYGFGWTPHGTYAQELTFFVNYVGFSPLDTIKCATLGGAKMMGRAHELGTLEPGKLADVLIVNGDVLQDISILENRNNLLAVMQGGVIKAGTMVRPLSA
jgi:cytosine/adenosine deaminase-related metal-dependent hydrolase